MILLEAERAAGREVRMMVSQPRRIAAGALADRLSRGKDGELIGLRMGHGERMETRSTRIWFCTSGYVVQLIAHHPEIFARFVCTTDSTCITTILTLSHVNLDTLTLSLTRFTSVQWTAICCVCWLDDFLINTPNFGL